MKSWKTILLVAIGLLGMGGYLFAKRDKSNHSEGIHWVTVEQANELMKKHPKKVYVDIYTDWCGWCKVMDKKTFSHAEVIKYMNANYYCIHMNAENTDEIIHQGKTYGAEGKNNALAVTWMQGKMSYPTSVFMDENFENPQPVPGYLEVNMMESIVKYIAENKHKTTPFDQWQNEFKPTWSKEESK